MRLLNAKLSSNGFITEKPDQSENGAKVFLDLASNTVIRIEESQYHTWKVSNRTHKTCDPQDSSSLDSLYSAVDLRNDADFEQNSETASLFCSKLEES